MNAVLERLAHEREQTHEMIDAVLQGANEADRDPTESERELLQRHRNRLGELEAQIGELADVEEQRQGARDVATLIRHDTPPQPAPTGLPVPDAGEPVYRTYGQWARDELLMRFDLIARQAPEARAGAGERLARVVANTLTSDVPGIVPTQHLAQIIDVINKQRPIVESARKVALSSGKLTYPTHHAAARRRRAGGRKDRAAQPEDDRGHGAGERPRPTAARATSAGRRSTGARPTR